jgi:hypothetical protein
MRQGQKRFAKSVKTFIFVFKYEQCQFSARYGEAQDSNPEDQGNLIFFVHHDILHMILYNYADERSKNY